MSEVKRYAVGPDMDHPGFNEMRPDQDGRWVRFEDYQAEREKREDTELKLGRLREALGQGDAEASYLTDYDRQMIRTFLAKYAGRDFYANPIAPTDCDLYAVGKQIRERMEGER